MPDAGAPRFMGRVLTLSGRTAPGGCGVEDYTTALVRSLREGGVHAEQAHAVTLREVVSVVLTAVREDAIVHVQYPVASWRKSLVPLLAVTALRCTGRARVAVTVHEFTQAHPLRRALCVALTRLAHAWVATTDVEARSARRWFGPRRLSKVIPVASNIPLGPSGAVQRREKVLFFGQLAPTKGLEAFVEMARWFPQVPFEVIGTPAKGQADWVEEMSRGSPAVTFRLGLASAGVAQALASGTIAYLPYPDGVSERRASALAVLEAGLQLVTTDGPSVTPALRNVTHVAAESEDASRILSGLLDGSRPPIAPAEVGAYLRQRSWPEIARAHRDFYCALNEGSAA